MDEARFSFVLEITAPALPVHPMRIVPKYVWRSCWLLMTWHNFWQVIFNLGGGRRHNQSQNQEAEFSKLKKKERRKKKEERKMIQDSSTTLNLLLSIIYD